MENQISDASDFAHTRVPKLSQLDTLLRCHICKEFLKVPVLTPCGHTFCSVCIREYINVQAKCPLCLTELRDSMLRSEFLVSEIIDTYKSIRSDILEIIKKPEDISESRGNTSLIELGSEQDDSLIIDADSNEDDDIQIIENSGRKPLKRTTTDLTDSSSLRNGPRSKYFKTNSKAKRSSTASRIDSMMKKSVELVPCPICEKYFPVKELERTHLDECLTLQSLGRKPKEGPVKSKPVLKKPRVTPSEKSLLLRSHQDNKIEQDDSVSHVDKYLNSTADTGHQRLPKLDLPSMTITQVKQKLTNLGLSTNGSKQDMIARYNYFEILWNSNFCDSLNPVEVSELKRQLLSWEASRKVHNSKGSSNSIGALMTSRSDTQNTYKKLLLNVKTDKFDRKGWCILFRKQFRRLIKDAKKMRKASVKGKEEPANDKVQEDIIVKAETPKEVANERIADAVVEKDVHDSTNKEHVSDSSPEEQLTDPDLSMDLLDSLGTRSHSS